MQQILVVGLGQFGMALAKALSAQGVEVLAVDCRRDLVEEAADFVAEAVTCNATDEEALAQLDPGRRDVAVCAIGADSKEASIICTALLRQMGVKKVVARAGDALHQRILTLVGAHQVINPEQEFGQRFATRLAHAQILSDMPLGDDLHLSEIKVPEAYVGKTLVDLALPRRFGVMVVALRRGEPARILVPRPDTPLAAGDGLLLVATQAAVHSLLKGA